MRRVRLNHIQIGASALMRHGIKFRVAVHACVHVLTVAVATLTTFRFVVQKSTTSIKRAKIQNVTSRQAHNQVSTEIHKQITYTRYSKDQNGKR
jgi:hypothetical protein